MDLSAICLALVIYSEARGEPLAGQKAVGHVVLNRASKKPICDVIYEVGQFQNIHRLKVKDRVAFNKAYRLAQSLLIRPLEDITRGATHFHATWIPAPTWAGRMEQTLHVGQHVFYREFPRVLTDMTRQPPIRLAASI